MHEKNQLDQLDHKATMLASPCTYKQQIEQQCDHPCIKCLIHMLSLLTLVQVGYYTDESVVTTIRGFETICPLGYYCPGDGLRYTCNAGLYGGTTGMYCRSIYFRSMQLHSTYTSEICNYIATYTSEVGSYIATYTSGVLQVCIYIATWI